MPRESRHLASPKSRERIQTKTELLRRAERIPGKEKFEASPVSSVLLLRRVGGVALSWVESGQITGAVGKKGFRQQMLGAAARPQNS